MTMRTATRHDVRGTCALALAALLAACAGGGGAPEVVVKPAWLGAVTTTAYDGTTDDLLTAGLGKTGLAGAAPAIANPLAPTAAELRRLAIYNNYRSLVDIAADGGYGTLYGPNVDVDGRSTPGEGKVAGTECARLRRRRLRRAERDAAGAGAGVVRQGEALHRDRDLVRLARRLRRASRPRASGASSAAARSPTRTRAAGPASHDLATAP